ncbi:MAG: regulatory protein RecX [Phycisphaerales bacterium]
MPFRRSSSRRIDEPPPELPEGAVITHLTPGRRGDITLRVNKQRIAALDPLDITALGLRIGGAWSDQLAGRVLAAAARFAAHRDAMTILARRAVSRAEMVRKLQRKGHAAALAANTAGDLVARGHIDDAAFAQHFAESITRRKPAGKGLIVAKLAQRGVARPAAETAAKQALSGHDQLAEARDLATRRLSRMPAKLDGQAVQRRLFGLLARRGFDPEICRRAVTEALKAAPRGRAAAGRDDKD